MTLTCSYSPGLVEPRSPASSESVPRKPRSPGTLRSPGCRVRFRVAGLRSPVGEEAAAVASAGGLAGAVSLLALAPTSGRGTAAGRELCRAEAAALRRQDAAVRRFGAPCWSRGLAPPAMLPPWGTVEEPPSLCCTRVRLPFSLAHFLISRFSHKDLFS